MAAHVIRMKKKRTTPAPEPLSFNIFYNSYQASIWNILHNRKNKTLDHADMIQLLAEVSATTREMRRNIDYWQEKQSKETGHIVSFPALEASTQPS